MRRIKRPLSLLLALMMIVALVAACASDNQADTPDQPTEPTETVEATAPPVQGVVGDGPVEVPDDGPPRGGSFVLASGGEPVGPFGDPWDPTLGFNTVREPYGLFPIAQRPDGTPNFTITIPELMTTGFNPENGWYYVEHTMKQNVYLHPHILSDAEHIDAEHIVWQAHTSREHTPWTGGVQDVVQTGPYSFRVYFENERNPNVMTIPGGILSSRLLYEEGGRDLLAAHPVSAGPFRVVNVVPGSHVHFERFDGFHIEGQPYLDEATIVWMTDHLVVEMALQSTGDDRVDGFNTFGAEITGNMINRGFNVISLRNNVISIVPGTNYPDDHPLRDINVLRAISAAVDRDLITQALGFGAWTPMYQFYAPGFRGHRTDPDWGVPRFDLEQARAYMAASNFPDGFETTFLPDGLVSDDVAEVIRQMLGEIGITGELERLEMAAYTEMRTQLGWDGLLFTPFTNWFHAEQTASVGFEHIEGGTPARIDVLNTDRMLELIRATEFFGDNSAEAYAFAEYIHENLYIIPLYGLGLNLILNPRIQGWLPTDHMLFWNRLWEAYE